MIVVHYYLDDFILLLIGVAILGWAIGVVFDYWIGN